MDGYVGFIVAYSIGFETLLRHGRLWEKGHGEMKDFKIQSSKFFGKERIMCEHIYLKYLSLGYKTFLKALITGNLGFSTTLRSINFIRFVSF